MAVLAALFGSGGIRQGPGTVRGHLVQGDWPTSLALPELRPFVLMPTQEL